MKQLRSSLSYQISPDWNRYHYNRRWGIAIATLGTAATLILWEILGIQGLAQAALRRSDSCGAVTQLQQELSRRAYAVGPIDGIFGPKTEFAVRRFQTDRGLAVTGQVGEATAIALNLSTTLNCTPLGPIANYRVVTPGAVLNRRQQPNGQILDQLADQTPVVVVERQAGWSRLQQGGWVASAYLAALGNGAIGQGGSGGGSPTRPVDPVVRPVPNPPSSCNHTALVNVAQLNLRNAPAGPVVSTIGEGEALCLTGEGRAADRRFWARLDNGNWVAADLLRLLN